MIDNQIAKRLIANNFFVVGVYRCPTERLILMPSSHGRDKPSNFLKPIGGNGSTNIGLGWGIIYYNIHNVLNPRKGIFSEWAFLSYSGEIGSDYNLTTYLLDNRFYIPIRKNNVLAFQLQGQFTTGSPPFNLLSLMGGESLMRGYYLGRYRDKHLMAGQVEYRMLPFSFAKRWGAS